jgi:hypothetical protein
MSNNDLAWSRYADLQKQSQQSQHLNDHIWGIERALNWLLASIETGTVPTSPTELDAALARAIASGSRLQRSRASALKSHGMAAQEPATTNPAVANLELARIAACFGAADANILFDAGFGYTHLEIAHRCSCTPGAVRVRLSRLRRRARVMHRPRSGAVRKAKVQLRN